MATLGDLKARIADEILKRNLTSQIALHITRAVEHYADHRFVFNEARYTGACTANSQYVALPMPMRVVDQFEVTVGGNSFGLVRRDLSVIEMWQGMSPATGGQPTDYALTGAQARLYLTPNQAYPLTVLGIADLTFTDDTTSNAWTNEASDLIAARSRMTLFRDVLRDMDGVSLAKDAITEAERALDRKTVIKVGTGRVRGYL